MSIDQFFELFKAEMSELRTKVVSGLFRRLDSEKKGFLKVDILADFYQTASHPAVRNGSVSERELKRELVKSFSDYLAIQVCSLLRRA